MKCKVIPIPQQEVNDTYKQDSQSNVQVTPVTPQTGKLNVNPMVSPPSIHFTVLCVWLVMSQIKEQTMAWDSPQSN